LVALISGLEGIKFPVIQMKRGRNMEGHEKDDLKEVKKDQKTVQVLEKSQIWPYSDFINKEDILLSALDNERSIPCLVDGLTHEPSKTIFSCIIRNVPNDLNVSQLAGVVGEISPYHHGKASIVDTIINLAQDYTGSNNINLLLPQGQFGTRLEGGKDAASPHVISTNMSPLTRLIFNPNDEHTLNYFRSDNVSIGPKWYVPIIPLVLVNGADGVGANCSTQIPNFNPREIVENIKQLLNGSSRNDLKPMHPWYNHFKGKIEQTQDQMYVMKGNVAKLNNYSVEITELPAETWTSNYKQMLWEMTNDGTIVTGKDKYITEQAKLKANRILGYKDYSTDTTVRFVVDMTEDQVRKANEMGIHKYFDLQTIISTSSMYLLDKNGCLKKYEDVRDILYEFYKVRLEYYGRRKIYLEGMVEAEALTFHNQAMFLQGLSDKNIIIENKRQIILELKRQQYDPDPIIMWQKAVGGTYHEIKRDEQESTESDYNYIMDMKLGETKDKLLENKDKKYQELNILRATCKENMWMDDLRTFSGKLNEMEQNTS